MAGFNLNRSSSADYSLKERQIKEMINLYGVEVDVLKTTKLNIDKVMKDFSHLKIGKEKIKITIMPEESSGWEGDMGFDMWGLHNQRTINFLISKDSFNELSDFLDKNAINDSAVLNSIIVLPSGTIMEITSFTTQVEGVNNLFTYSDSASVYRLVTKVYNNSKQNEIERTTELEKTNSDKEVENNFDDIDNYFKMLDTENDEIEEQGSTISNSDTVFGTMG